MKKPKRTRKQFASTLIQSLMVVFDAAYLRHQFGESEDALIIEHDIIAANAGDADVIVTCHRRAIKAAVSAVDECIPFSIARSHMLNKLNERAEELIAESGEP